MQKSRDKWTQDQEERAGILFEMYPKLKEANNLVNSLRNIFKNKKLNKDSAKTLLHLKSHQRFCGVAQLQAEGFQKSIAWGKGYSVLFLSCFVDIWIALPRTLSGEPVFPQMYEVDEGEETKVLAACNKITRELNIVKVYIDQTLKNVSASCEFYCNGEESLKTCLGKSMEILGIVRFTFLKTMRSFG